MTIHNFIKETTIADQELRAYEEDKDYINDDEDINVTPNSIANNLANTSQQRKIDNVQNGICDAIIQYHKNTCSV